MIFQYVTHSTRNPLSGFWTGHGEWLNLEKKIVVRTKKTKLIPDKKEVDMIFLTKPKKYKIFWRENCYSFNFCATGKDREIDKKKIDDFFYDFFGMREFYFTIPFCSTRISQVGKCAAFQLWTPIL